MTKHKAGQRGDTARKKLELNQISEAHKTQAPGWQEWNCFFVQLPTKKLFRLNKINETNYIQA